MNSIPINTKRRDFLVGLTASSAVVTMPGFLAGCGLQSANTLTSPVPDNPFLDWFDVDQSVLATTMSALTSKGADFADLYFQHARKHSMTVENGVVSSGGVTIDQGVGLRAVVGDQVGFASTEDMTLPSLRNAAISAAGSMAGSPALAPNSFAPAAVGELYATAIPWSEIGAEPITAMLHFVEERVRKADPAIESVIVRWNDSDERIMIATADGRLVTDRRPMGELTIVVTARKGESVQTGFTNIAAREELSWFSEERLLQAVTEVVDRTMIQFDARRAPEGDMPVVLASGTSGVLLHEAVGHGMEADFIRNGNSAYVDMIGKKVAEPIVSIVDQANMRQERGALNYDDEGNQTGRTTMVEDGVLKSYLHDQLSAKHYETETTASGRRESFRYPPMPRMTCTYMEDGPHTKEEIIAAVDHGIVCETYVDGAVKIGPGDYTFSVKNGWLIENGKITAPIKDVSISGIGPETLSQISMVANDLRMDVGGWTCGKNGQNVPVSQGVPTVLVSEMSVGSISRS